jgi:hypothetical protein
MKNLLAVISLIQRAQSKRLLVRAISHMVVIMGLVMTTAIMVSAMVIGGLMSAHAALLTTGIPPHTALISIGVAALFVITLLVFLIGWRLRNLQNIPRALFEQHPFTSRAMGTLNAFTDGLMAD